jgi:dienelactone hydrolase
MRPTLILALLTASMLLPYRGAAATGFAHWPDLSEVATIAGTPVTFPSHSPYTLKDVGGGPDADPPSEAVGTLYLPAVIDVPVPAVVMLHGASGLRGQREQTYGRQLAGMGIAVLVLDAFAPRRHMARGFVERVLTITETMLIADAYAGLRYLDSRPEIDGDRVLFMGFSYGGRSAVIASYAQVAERFAPGSERFAGHIALYAPCIARFEDTRTTGAPVLMLMGDDDAMVDPERCAQILADLERGGSQARMVVYPGAHHQWDGRRTVPWRAPRHLADCAIMVDADGDVYDERTHLPMMGPTTRRIILGLCSDGDGYLVHRDDEIRARSNQDLGRFLDEVFAPPQG